MKYKNIFKKTSLFVLLTGLFFGFIFIIFYFLNPLSGLNRTFFKVAPYPLVLINNRDIITSRTLLNDLESLEKFYSSQNFSEMGMRVDFETEEGKERLKIKEKEVLNKLIENKLISLIANSKGIYVSKKEAEEELVSKAEEAGNTENLALNLKKLYGWSLSDFRDKVVIPRIYLKKIIAYHQSEISADQLDQSQIKKAYAELQSGKSFDDVAKKYSQGETAQNGGELGWFKRNYLASEIAEKVYSLQPGEYSEIITSPLGNHIVFLEETRGEENEKEVKIKQIFTNEGSFLNWLNQEKSKFSIKVISKDYVWDKNLTKIKFSNEENEQREALLRSKSNGDPSLY